MRSFVSPESLRSRCPQLASPGPVAGLVLPSRRTRDGYAQLRIRTVSPYHDRSERTHGIDADLAGERRCHRA